MENGIQSVNQCVWLRCIIFVAITIIDQNLQIHGASIKRINNTNLTTINQNVDLPIDVKKAVLPIYQSLCKSKMLKICLHDKT